MTPPSTEIRLLPCPLQEAISNVCNILVCADEYGRVSDCQLAATLRNAARNNRTPQPTQDAIKAASHELAKAFGGSEMYIENVLNRHLNPKTR